MNENLYLIERFRRGAELVAVTLTGAAGPELDWTPAPDKWSVRQIICHLADTEMITAFRFRRIIAEQEPQLEGWDQNAWAEKLDYKRRKSSQALEAFRRMRAENFELLKELPPEAFDRVGVHTRIGRKSLRDFVELFADHAEKHAQQMRERRAEYKQFRAKSAQK